MTDGSVDCPINDADNHMYETQDAFTRHLPARYSGLIKYVQVNGRTKIAVKNAISDYIPNPTFEVVARPGAQQDYFKNGNPEGRSRREILGEPMRAVDAYFAPEPRLRLMDELGINRAIMWPTLASLLEERLSDDPRAMHAVVHAFNEWMYEQWTFNYRDRIFPTPVITLPIVEKAIEELELVVSRGARIVLIRPAPVPGLEGTRSFALPEFDPFWRKVVEADIAVGMHASDDGSTRYLNVWEGGGGGEFLPFKSQSAFEEVFRHQHRGILDAMLSAVCHGLFTRFPSLRVMPVENGSVWVGPLLDVLEHTYGRNPHLFDEDPVAAFRRNVWVHPFHEDDPLDVVRLLGADRVLFGSDYPHPEGLAAPADYFKRLDGLPPADIARIMGGNLAAVMKFAA
ncbi:MULTISPECIES: amidohydrolase family protein [unclassified Frankia]|uniref:amidohydrolase family protein n=1 Tax=unclassified Frankia TaxID=2632575 RepID=UPI0027DADC99|nr:MULTISPECIES: amidohydrolase family protein [unclassified Frankia]